MRLNVTAALCGLLLSGFLVAAAPASVASDSLGTTTASNQVLHSGCHGYSYSYRITPPPNTSTWSADLFLIGPKGGKLGSAYLLSPADPASGKRAWRLCRAAIVPGKYTIRMRVTSIDIYDLTTTWVEPTTFRISRP
jgi:hypothetical protein